MQHKNPITITTKLESNYFFTVELNDKQLGYISRNCNGVTPTQENIETLWSFLSLSQKKHCLHHHSTLNQSLKKEMSAGGNNFVKFTASDSKKVSSIAPLPQIIDFKISKNEIKLSNIKSIYKASRNPVQKQTTAGSNNIPTHQPIALPTAKEELPRCIRAMLDPANHSLGLFAKVDRNEVNQLKHPIRQFGYPGRAIGRATDLNRQVSTKRTFK